MKETEFIEQNEASWRELEDLLNKPFKDADLVHRLFLKVSSDLSYARSFFPNRSVRVYLNQLTQRAFNEFVKKEKKGIFESVQAFFRDILPAELFHSRKYLLISFLFFATSVLIGALSSKHNESFAALILGDHYVEMTEENINEGDPMAVYKDEDKGSMFFMITINNIRVALLTFIIGIFGSFFSYLILLSNGIMLGSFQYFFYSKGLFLTSFLTIWIHGTIEISAIIIAGAAGIIMGNGLLFPGTYSRSKSIQIAAKRGLRIFLGTVPLFIIAGVLESFVTRLTDMPAIIKVIIIVGSLLFIFWMFLFYPWLRHKQGLRYETIEISPSEDVPLIFDKYGVRSFAENLGLSFMQFSKFLGSYIRLGVIPVIVLFSVLFYYLIDRDHHGSVDLIRSYNLFSLTFGGWFLFFLYSLVLNYLLHLLLNFIHNDLGDRKTFLDNFKNYYLITLPLSIIMVLSLYMVDDWMLNVVLLLLASPPFILIIGDKLYANEKLSIADLAQVYKSAWSSYTGLIMGFLVLFLVFLLLQKFGSSLSSFLAGEFLSWHQLFEMEQLNSLYLTHLIKLVVLLILFPLSSFLFYHVYFTNYSQKHGTDLYNWYETFGKLPGKQ